MTPQRTEAETQKAILTWLHVHPLVAWAARINSGQVKTAHGTWYRGAPEGTADILGMLRGGRMLAIEVKRDAKKKPSDAQVAFLSAIKQHGGLAFVAHSIACCEKHLGRIG